MFKELKKEAFYYGFPVALACTKNKQTGEDNITPISSTWLLGNSIVCGIGLVNKGYLNLKNGSELTLNLPDEKLLEQVIRISRTTGNSEIPDWKQSLNYSYCKDKFSFGSFTKLAGVKVSTSRIKECPIQLEAKVNTIGERGEFAVVEGEILNILVSEDILHDESHIDVEKWRPLIYKFREYTSTGDGLGKDARFSEFSSQLQPEIP